MYSDGCIFCACLRKAIEELAAGRPRDALAMVANAQGSGTNGGTPAPNLRASLDRLGRHQTTETGDELPPPHVASPEAHDHAKCNLKYHNLSRQYVLFRAQRTRRFRWKSTMP
jgi:hypothetical protein